jgi:uncharacterized protein (TIGR03086 family)
MHTNEGAGIVALDAQAVSESVRLVTQATAADLARPTPCADWTLHGLLRHMATQHYGFAAASAGDGDLARWRLRPLGDDPVAAYRESAECVLGAFAAEGVLERDFPLPEFTRGLMFPGAQAISFHFVDYVVHSWDVARTLGLPARFSPALLAAALKVARAVPGGDARQEPGAPFAPEVASPGGSRLDQIVAILGRSPRWRPPGADDSARRPQRRAISSGSVFEEQIGYARAVVDGGWVQVSGTTGFDYATMTVPDDVVEQAEQCLRNIEAALAEAGCTLADVVRVRYLLPHRADFEPCWPLLRRRFGDVRPAATMLVCGLADPRMKIEIEVDARQPGQGPA